MIKQVNEIKRKNELRKWKKLRKKTRINHSLQTIEKGKGKKTKRKYTRNIVKNN
jgi:hypothetical protein